VGDELDIPQGLKGSWFASAASAEAKSAKENPAKAEPKALSKLGSAEAKKFNDVLA
jgi:hypothetical protein